eukprot:TRINITY_DN42829_c0_g1_i2.p1 TRINITY_DN42829_c0_g1~~TRINITY_DN42829_c0_g1_i2.p1  ORF type:complete len:353 (+),score=45.82 TRINITY_DN42829_c0_g1_i2:64-1122(+)
MPVCCVAADNLRRRAPVHAPPQPAREWCSAPRTAAGLRNGRPERVWLRLVPDGREVVSPFAHAVPATPHGITAGARAALLAVEGGGTDLSGRHGVVILPPLIEPPGGGADAAPSPPPRPADATAPAAAGRAGRLWIRLLPQGALVTAPRHNIDAPSSAVLAVGDRARLCGFQGDDAEFNGCLGVIVPPPDSPGCGEHPEAAGGEAAAPHSPPAALEQGGGGPPRTVLLPPCGELAAARPGDILGEAEGLCAGDRVRLREGCGGSLSGAQGVLVHPAARPPECGLRSVEVVVDPCGTLLSVPECELAPFDGGAALAPGAQVLMRAPLRFAGRLATVVSMTPPRGPPRGLCTYV